MGGAERRRHRPAQPPLLLGRWHRWLTRRARRHVLEIDVSERPEPDGEDVAGGADLERWRTAAMGGDQLASVVSWPVPTLGPGRCRPPE